MAAGQKAVESTATTQEEDHVFQMQAREVLRGSFQEIVKEGLSEKILRERLCQDHSEVTDQEEASVKILREEASVKTQKEEALATTDHADHSERILSVHADHSVKDLSVQEDLLMKMEKEGHSEETEEAAASEILPRRASQEEISTISVTRTKAESTR